MRDGGRLAAAIEVLEDIETRHRPVRLALKAWGDASRYAGAKDRAWVSGLVLDVLRRRRSLGWRMGEESVRAAIRFVLERDYELAFASNGEEALAAFQRQQPDLVLLDLKMPKRDGMEVLTVLRAQAPSVRVIILTTYQSVELAQRATRYGAIDYVPKPFTRDQLRQAVERALRLPAWQRPAPTA